MVAVPQLPSLVGQAWPVTRTTLWSATKETAFNGASVAYSNWSYPRYKWTLSYNYLGAGNINGQTNTDWQTLSGFYDRMQGSANLFQYSDPDDCQVAALQQFGTGDGVTTGFQLSRIQGFATSPVFAPRINLVFEDLANKNYWALGTPIDSIISAANILDPLGGNNAVKFSDGNTVTGSKGIGQAGLAALYPNTDYTCSVYVKAVERSWILLNPIGNDGSSINKWVSFNGSTGAIGSYVNNAKNIFCISVGNGWYRCGFTFNSGSLLGVAPGLNIYTMTNGDGSGTSYAGVVGNGLYLFGPQLEIGAQLPAGTADGTYASPFPMGPIVVQSPWQSTPMVGAARTSLLLYSQDLSNAAWTKSACTATAVSGHWPDLTTSSLAGRLVETATTASHFVQQNVTGLTTQTVYTFSILVEAALRPWCWVQMSTADGIANQWVNLSTGALGGTTGSTISWLKVTTKKYISSGAEVWWQISGTVSTGTGTNIAVSVGSATGDTVSSFAGNSGSDALYIWGGALEKGAVTNNYILTTSLAVTKTDYTMDNYGFVTFSAAPGNTQPMYWMGTYNWYCRFDDDNTDFTNAANNIWSAPKLSFTSVKFGTAV